MNEFSDLSFVFVVGRMETTLSNTFNS